MRFAQILLKLCCIGLGNAVRQTGRTDFSSDSEDLVRTATEGFPFQMISGNAGLSRDAQIIVEFAQQLQMITNFEHVAPLCEKYRALDKRIWMLCGETDALSSVVEEIIFLNTLPYRATGNPNYKAYRITALGLTGPDGKKAVIGQHLECLNPVREALKTRELEKRFRARLKKPDQTFRKSFELLDALEANLQQSRELTSGDIAALYDHQVRTFHKLSTKQKFAVVVSELFTICVLSNLLYAFMDVYRKMKFNLTHDAHLIPMLSILLEIVIVLVRLPILLMNAPILIQELCNTDIPDIVVPFVNPDQPTNLPHWTLSEIDAAEQVEDADHLHVS